MTLKYTTQTENVHLFYRFLKVKNAFQIIILYVLNHQKQEQELTCPLRLCPPANLDEPQIHRKVVHVRLFCRDLHVKNI